MVRNTVIGGLIGLALGILLAIALERRDRRVRDPHQIEDVFARPIIGTIPRSRSAGQGGPGNRALPPPEAEAFRTVRANLRHQLGPGTPRSVLVTSANPGEGKTTVVWNLARMEAAAGTRVLLVEADMRRPVLGAKLGANGAAGLSELLAGKEPLQSVVWSVEFEDRVNGGSARGTADVLFAGKPTANPSELLDSERMQAVLEVVADSYDLVLVDTPPTSVVSDAMPILDLVGGVVVVGRIGLTTHESIIEPARPAREPRLADRRGDRQREPEERRRLSVLPRRRARLVSSGRTPLEQMPVVILSGGLGTRLREETETRAEAA